MTDRQRILFKQITTHHAHRGLYGLDESGNIWQYYSEGAKWVRLVHPTEEVSTPEVTPFEAKAKRGRPKKNGQMEA